MNTSQTQSQSHAHKNSNNANVITKRSVPMRLPSFIHWFIQLHLFANRCCHMCARSLACSFCHSHWFQFNCIFITLSIKTAHFMHLKMKLVFRRMRFNFYSAFFCFALDQMQTEWNSFRWHFANSHKSLTQCTNLSCGFLLSKQFWPKTGKTHKNIENHDLKRAHVGFLFYFRKKTSCS